MMRMQWPVSPRRPAVLPRFRFSSPGPYVFPLVEGNRDIVEVDRRESSAKRHSGRSTPKNIHGDSLTPSTYNYCNGTGLGNGAQGGLRNLTFDLSD